MYPNTDMYPVDVRFREDAPINRLWGIPVLGYIVRWCVLIPHFIVLFFLGIAARSWGSSPGCRSS